MTAPLVSVILPAYNGADVIGEAIQSVLDQTYTEVEVLVADDCSTDRTREVVRGFADSRVRLFEHGANRGPDAARFTALRASAGEIIAFLDQDDLFLPEKLAAHVQYLEAHPETGLTYNPFFVTTAPGLRVQVISRPPTPLTLADLVLGFPLPPSTWVFRRHWALFDEIWDERTMLRGREVVVLGRLFVAGCGFGLVDQVLNHRRIHVGRRFENPAGKCAAERRCQDIMLADPRCTDDTRAAREQAAANAWLVWANVALAQDDTDCGRELLRHALGLDPGLNAGEPNRLAEYFMGHAVIEAADAEEQLRRVFGQLDGEVPGLVTHLDWTVGQAHLIQGARHVIWERPTEAQAHWDRVSALGAVPDDAFLRRVAHEILDFEQACGWSRVDEVLGEMGRRLGAAGGSAVAGRLKGAYRMARAFHQYGQGRRGSVPIDVLGGMISDPREMKNRGAWSILLRSALTR